MDQTFVQGQFYEAIPAIILVDANFADILASAIGTT
jgi:hypothetical protein